MKLHSSPKAYLFGLSPVNCAIRNNTGSSYPPEDLLLFQYPKHINQLIEMPSSRLDATAASDKHVNKTCCCGSITSIQMDGKAQ
ncbi:hypothetical protein T265_10240 [Opisthorchis viverrini]|uniref:Uncharacterized protein n=1 Tax=Opisthorchis viverrini TaxID=6198 RepID=A0A074Z768_OPIVI|nr:hypothetical protein T265_10240 [Opisthorchis viverrini]KER21422.1 hypothetical protein T265_10240 [Opisthorchis viverrini]